MRRVLSLPLLCALLFVCSCFFVSLHPYASKDQAIFDQALVGSWTDDGRESIVLERSESKVWGKDTYRLIMEEKGKTELVGEAVLTEIDGVRYLQITAERGQKDKGKDENIAMIFQLPTYMLWRCELNDEGDLELQPASFKYLEKLAEENEGEIPGLDYYTHQESWMVLTSSTEELRAFVAKHHGNEGFYQKAKAYERAEEKKQDRRAQAEPRPQIEPATTKEARRLYQSRCATCHGKEGRGDGPAAMSLDPKPRDYSRSEWQQSVEDEYLKKFIVKGGAAMDKSAAMPPNPDLKEKPGLLEALVQVIRSFDDEK